MKPFAPLAALSFLFAGCVIFPPLASVSDAQLIAAAPSIEAGESLAFRGYGNVRVHNLSGTIVGSEILITDKSVVAMDGGGRSGTEPVSALAFKRADVAKVVDGYLSFIEIQLKNGDRHFLEILKGRKPEVLRLLASSTNLAAK